MGQEKTGLLSTRKATNYSFLESLSLLLRWGEVYNLQHGLNLGIDIVNLLRKTLLKESTDSEGEFRPRNNLPRNSDSGSGLNIDISFVWVTIAGNQRKDSTFTSTVLTHQSKLGATAYYKTRLL